MNRLFRRRGLALQWAGGVVAMGGLFAEVSAYVFWLGASLFALGWILEIMSRGNITFWAKVKDYPDLAYDWFQTRGEWVVVEGGLSAESSWQFKGREWVGPFRLCVPKLNGRMTHIYGKANEYEGTESDFLQLVRTGNS